MVAIADLPMPNTYARVLVQMTPEPQRLLAGTGLSMEDLLQRDGTISVWQQLICTRNSASLLQQPDWHLAWLHRVADRFHGPITAACLSAPTAGDGLDIFVQFLPTRVPYLGWQVFCGPAMWQVSVRPLMDLGTITALSLEVPLLTLGWYLQTVLGTQSVVDARYEFPHSPLTEIGNYSKIVAGSFSFGMARAALVIPISYRARPNPGHDAAVWGSAKRRCEATAQEHADTAIIPTVLQMLYESFESRLSARVPPTLEGMAKQLHFSPSTMNRRLRDAATSYHALVDDVRRHLALEYLANGRRQVADVASELGFLEPSSFIRSFKRWYGQTPGRFRRLSARSLP